MDLLKSISIIIPAWNDHCVLKDTLKSLLEINFNKKLCQIIVVAGGNDGTYEFASSLANIFIDFNSFKVIRQGPEGKNAALKKGIELLDNETKIIILLDADTKVDKYWLKEIMQYFNKSDCDALTGSCTSVRKENYISLFYSYQKIRANVIEKNISLAGGGMIAFKSDILKNKEIFEKLFSSDILVDDYNFSEVLKDNSYKLGFAEKAHAYTYLPSTFWEFIKNENRWIPAWISYSHKKKWFKLRLMKTFLVFFSLLFFVILSIMYTSSWIFFTSLCLPLMYLVIKSFESGYSVYKQTGDKLFLQYLIPYVILIILSEYLLLLHYLNVKFNLYKPNRFFKGPRPNQ
jgi:cellulose synthase/poly-beta-1,6-N-acetylglucosamine synthase-like glycosyltransferase